MNIVFWRHVEGGRQKCRVLGTLMLKEASTITLAILLWNLRTLEHQFEHSLGADDSNSLHHQGPSQTGTHIPQASGGSLVSTLQNVGAETICTSAQLAPEIIVV